MVDSKHSNVVGSADVPHAPRHRASLPVSSKPRQRADKPDGEGKGISRHDETAGRYLLASIPRASADQTVGAVIADLMSHKYDCLDIVCVLDAEEHLIGVMPLTSLFALPRETKIGSVVHDSFPETINSLLRARIGLSR